MTSPALGALVAVVKDRFGSWERPAYGDPRYVMPRRHGGPWPDGQSPVEADDVSALWDDIEGMSTVPAAEPTEATDDRQEVTTR